MFGRHNKNFLSLGLASIPWGGSCSKEHVDQMMLLKVRMGDKVTIKGPHLGQAMLLKVVVDEA
jgi:hypothetical protein